MIERLWLHPSGVATLAIGLSVLLWRVCALAMWASSVHSAFASVPAATFSFLKFSAMMSTYVASQSTNPVLRRNSALAFAYRGHCTIACLLVSILSWQLQCVHLPAWLV